MASTDENIDIAMNTDTEHQDHFREVQIPSESSRLLGNDNKSYLSTETGSSSSDVENHNEIESDTPLSRPASKGAAATISLLLIGVFVANVDSSLVLATNSAIASSFTQLQSASWLTTSYVMANCAVQPIVGKFSDIFGRKTVLLVCYSLFALGSGLCGLGQSMWQVIAGRSIAGLGGAGMSVIVAVVITDLVPMREVASWRSYVNVVATTGRMVGGPLGGFLADLVGWRLSFLGQVPLIVAGALLIAWKFKSDGGSIREDLIKPNGKPPSKIRRIDFLGAALLSSAIISFLFAVDAFADHASEQRTKLALICSAFVVLILSFLVVEAKHAREPIFPPKLILKRDVATTYTITLFQSAAQLAMMFSVPLYFQVADGASNTKAGSQLVPAFVGNTLGALLTGFYIKKTGRYKKAILIASLLACSAYITVILRWHGKNSAWEALEIAPGGFGSGVAGTAAFIALTSHMAQENMAVATSGFFLFSSLGTVLGVSLSSSIQRKALKSLLLRRLPFSNEENLKIIGKILADVHFLKTLKQPLKDIVKGTYITSLEYSHVFSIVCSAVGFVAGLFVQEHPLL